MTLVIWDPLFVKIVSMPPPSPSKRRPPLSRSVQEKKNWHFAHSESPTTSSLWKHSGILSKIVSSFCQILTFLLSRRFIARPKNHDVYLVILWYWYLDTMTLRYCDTLILCVRLLVKINIWKEGPTLERSQWWNWTPMPLWANVRYPSILLRESAKEGHHSTDQCSCPIL